MMLIPRCIIVMSLLIQIAYIYSEPKIITPSSQIGQIELSKNIETLIESIESQELSRAEIHQQITNLLINILDKNNHQSVHEYLNQINKLLQLLNKNKKFNFNPLLDSYFNKLTQLNPTPRKEFLKTLPEQMKNDLEDKEIFEALQFFIKNKNKQNALLDSLFWIEADKRYHFLRVFNRVLPKNLQINSIYPLLDAINNKK